MKTIDLNCDLGEGGAYDAQLMTLITSCSIACGGHYGNLASMSTAVALAKKHGVKIGAHPSYPDQLNFGRKSLEIGSSALKASLKEQILQLKEVADANNYPLTHIKPHGALYNDANSNIEIAEVIIETLLELQLKIPLFVAYNSKISKIGSGNIDMFFEGFSDRNYNLDHTLVSRNLPHAIIKNKEKVLTHVLNMIQKNRVEVATDVYVPIKVDSICMHSDTQNAVESLQFLQKGLIEAGIIIQAYNA